MADPFLYLKLTLESLQARVMEKSASRARTTARHSVSFADLPGPENQATLFSMAMAEVAATITIQACTTAVVEIASPMVSFRNISFPFSSEKKIRQVLPFELGPCLPQPEVPQVIDFFPLDIEFVPGQSTILCAAAEEARVADIVDTLKALGIRPLAITPGGYACAVRFLKQHPKIPDLIFIHMDTHTHATLTLCAGHTPVQVRSIPFSNLERLAEEIHIMAKGFKLRTGDPRKFDMVLYAPKTPTATIPGIPRPLRQVKKDELAPCLMPDRLPPFLINFCKGRFGSDSIFHQHRSQWIVTLFLVIVLAGAALLDIYQDISGLEQAIARERQKAYAIYKQTFPEKGTSTINAPELLMESYVNQALKNHRSNNIQTRMEALPAVRVMDMLSELSGRIPDTIDVDLSRLIFNRDQLIISGSLDTFNNVDKLKGLIEKSDLFKKVTISSAKASKTDNRVLFKFIIQM